VIWRGHVGDPIRTTEYALQLLTVGVIVGDRAVTLDLDGERSPAPAPGDTVFVVGVEDVYDVLWLHGKLLTRIPPAQPSDTTRYRADADAHTVQASRLARAPRSGSGSSDLPVVAPRRSMFDRLEGAAAGPRAGLAGAELRSECP
jgi:hypothetical protein